MPAGGGGGSFWAITSPHGRYVVFASSAADLCLVTNGLPIPGRIPAPLNVYLRDRLYGTNMLASPNVSGVTGGNEVAGTTGLKDSCRRTRPLASTATSVWPKFNPMP